MKLIAHWQTIPLDARTAYFAVCAFVLGFGLSVLLGPDMFIILLSLFILLTLLIIFVVLGISLAFRQNRRRRVPPFLMVSSCLLMYFLWPSASIDLHLIFRVYLAGGPNSLNDWAQGTIRDQAKKPRDSLQLRDESIPPAVRRYLGGFATVGGTLWSDEMRLRIELGGGFYHYGVVVYSRDNPPPPEWWQGILGWPPEVVIYHET